MRTLNDKEKAVLFDALTGEHAAEYQSFVLCERADQPYRIKRFIVAKQDDDPSFAQLPYFAALAADTDLALEILAQIPAVFGLDRGYGGGNSVNEILLDGIFAAAGRDLVKRFYPNLKNMTVQMLAMEYFARTRDDP
jgi:hypothetical protein